MNSRTIRRFWEMYAQLPGEVRQAAREAYKLFAENPAHPGLHFKQLQGYDNYWSVRVSISYRAVCKRQGDTVIWFWIGTHADFDHRFR